MSLDRLIVIISQPNQIKIQVQMCWQRSSLVANWAWQKSNSCWCSVSTEQRTLKQLVRETASSIWITFNNGADCSGSLPRSYLSINCFCCHLWVIFPYHAIDTNASFCPSSRVLISGRSLWYLYEIACWTWRSINWSMMSVLIKCTYRKLRMLIKIRREHVMIYYWFTTT